MSDISEKLEDYFIIQDGKKLKYGYTTGSCATAGAMACAQMLLSGKEISEVSLKTKFGIRLNLEVIDIKINENSVTCAIEKDAGDDPDITNGILVYTTVSKNNLGKIVINGGKGVGKVTRKGLDQDVGESAINSTPRKTIHEEVLKICGEFSYSGGLDILVEIPKGEELAKKTFNPRLGIEGGLSVLGTSGIVVPMSEDALLKTIEVEIKSRMANGDKYLLITPGNYGEAYVSNMELPLEKNIKCSNFVGKTIDLAVKHEAKGILFVSHIGKFIKVAGGIMDTHSKSADCRAELMASCSLLAGGNAELARELLGTVTTDESLEILSKNSLMEETMDVVMKKIHKYLKIRGRDNLKIGAIVFSNVFGYLGKTENVDEIITCLKEENK